MQTIAKQEDTKARVYVTVLLPANEEKNYPFVFKVSILPNQHLKKFNQRN